METIGNTIGKIIDNKSFDTFLNSIISGVKSFGDFVANLFNPDKNPTLGDVLNNLGVLLAGVFKVAWNNSIGSFSWVPEFKNGDNRINNFGDITKVNDGDISPSGLVISKPTPMGLKPVAQGAPNDTAYLRKNGVGGNVNVNINGTLKLDLGMGVSVDIRRDLINNPEFKYNILQLISNNMIELNNGTA